MIGIMLIASVITGLLSLVAVRAQETSGTLDGDYPNYLSIPESSFKCSHQKYIPGFYADLETKCQVYHFCFEDGQETFLCPVGSIFNQAKLACDTWQNSNCSLAPQLYSTNSGPLLESARKNVPMLIKLRNRSQNRSSVRETAANVYEKITSLYESSTHLAQSDAEDSNIVNGIKAEQNPEINNEFESNVMSAEQTAENESPLEDILSRFEANIQNDAPEEGVYYSDYSDGSQEAADYMQANVLYDPVTRQYYVDHDSSQNEWLQNSEDVNQQGLDDYANFANKYRTASRDYEVSSDFGSELSTSTYVDEFHGLSNAEAFENEELSNRLFSMEQSRRLRQKPIYTGIGEDDYGQPPSGIRSVKYPIPNYENFATESVAEVSSEPAVQITEESEMTDDLSYPNFKPLNAFEVPLPSEEFQHGIPTEFISPENEEHDLKVLATTSDREQRSDEWSENDSRDLQRDDPYTYIENVRPDDYEYAAAYNTDDDIVESVETNMDTREENEDRADFYQTKEETGEDPVESDDTYVVIPDETDTLEEYSEANKMSDSSDDSTSYGTENEQKVESDNAHESYASNYCSPNCQFPGGYVYIDPSQYHPSQYHPSQYHPSQYHPSQYSSAEFGREQFARDGYVDPETRELSSPYEFADESYYSADDTGATGSEFRKYNFDDEDASNKYMFASPPYAYDQSAGLTDYIYGAQNGYLHEGYYSNPYLEGNRNLGYDLPELEVPSESSVSNVFDDAVSDANGEYSPESSVPFWIQSDSSSDSLSEQIKTDDRISEEISPDLYGDETLSAIYDSNEALDSENMEDVALRDGGSASQDETYYVFDFDNDENIEVQSDDESLISDASENDQNIVQQSFQPETPLQSIEPAESKDDSQAEENLALQNGNLKSDISGSSFNTESKHGTDFWSFQATESDQHGKSVSFPPTGHLGRSDMEASQTSDTRNIHVANIYLNSMEFPESTNFGSYGVSANMGQQHDATGSSTFGLKNGLRRAGDAALPNISKLSVLQERIRSLKQGKFGAFKKYVSATGNKT